MMNEPSRAGWWGKNTFRKVKALSLTIKSKETCRKEGKKQ